MKTMNDPVIVKALLAGKQERDFFPLLRNFGVDWNKMFGAKVVSRNSAGNSSGPGG